MRHESGSAKVEAPSAARDVSTPTIGIDWNSRLPLYHQLRLLIEDEIRSGRWRIGQRVHPESEICRQFGVSRATVRHALAGLELDGLVNRVRGRGTFVSASSPRAWMLQSSDGFFQDEVGRLGRKVTSTVLECEVKALPEWAAQKLGLSAGMNGLVVRRLRAVDGEVALYVVNCLIPTIAWAVRPADLEHTSLYAQLDETAQIEVGGGRRALEAVPASEELSGLLDVRLGTPLVFVESVSWDRAQRPFDCYRAWLRSDRLSIEIEVGAKAVRQ